MSNADDTSICLGLTGENRLAISCTHSQPGSRYKYYIYNGKSILDKLPFSEDSEKVYWLTNPGKYVVKVLIIESDGSRKTYVSEPVNFQGIRVVMDTGEKRDPLAIFKNVYIILKEIWVNRGRMIRVSLFDHKVLNTDTYLGGLWNIISPIIQVFTYWFVFGVGIRQKAPFGNHPYFIWMLCGLIPWFFISASIIKGSNSIYSKGEMILKLQYPTSTIPVGTVLVNFYNHLWSMGILLIVMLVAGYTPTLYWLNLIYYMVYAILFLSALGLITSVLTMLARDFQNLLSSTIRLLFYLSPILWSPDKMPPDIQFIMKLNPIAYITDGFRDSLLYNVSFYVYWKKNLFFLVLLLVMIVIGSNLQVKVRDDYIDLM